MNKNDIIKQLTLEEKMLLLTQGEKQGGYDRTYKLDKYGVEQKFMFDGPHGIRADTAENCTSFPNLCCAGASWDKQLLYKMGEALADECYAIGVCERCKSTDPVELYVGDIKKIKEYLDTKNVKTSMWAEKLLKAFTSSGTPIGGNPCGGFKNGGQWFNPPLWKCRDLLPQDIKYVHWYWEFGDHHDRVYHDREYEMHFGNLSAIFINNWKKRIGWGAKGGWVSNWGSFEEEYMQRNKQYFDLISGAYAFWNDDFDSSKKEKLLKITFKEAYKHKWENEKNVIKLRHRTRENIPHEYFWCGVFIEDGKYLLGNYEVEYADGTKALLPVKYGTNIGACSMPSYPLSRELFQLAGSVLPIGENGDFFYECKYKNPNPKSKILSIKYVPIKQEFTVEYEVK